MINGRFSVYFDPIAATLREPAHARRTPVASVRRIQDASLPHRPP